MPIMTGSNPMVLKPKGKKGPKKVKVPKAKMPKVPKADTGAVKETTLEKLIKGKM